MESQKEQLKKLFELAIDFTKIAIEQHQEELEPSFVSLHGNQVDMIVTPWRNDSEKVFLVQKAWQKLKEDGVIAYVHFSEAWSRSFPADTDTSKILPIRDYEDKQEVIVITGATKDGHKMGSTIAIDRDDDNKRSLGKRQDITESDSIQGSMASLLDD